MASLRIFTRSKLSSFFQAYCKTECQRIVSPIVFEVQKRWSGYRSSPIYKDPSKYTDFEITSDPKEWQYVERLFPYKTVPLPPDTTKLEIGWKPQNVTDKNLPYFIARTRNHMQPVFLIRSHRGMRKLTYIRKIQGDIWQFESDVKKLLQANSKQVIGSRINELAGVVIFRGDHVSAVKRFLDSKGL